MPSMNLRAIALVIVLACLAPTASSSEKSADETRVSSAKQGEVTEAAIEAHKRSLLLTGPTGWIQTAEGKLRFVRLGTLDERHVLSFGGYDPKDIVSVTWNAACCDVTLKLRNGKQAVISEGAISHVTFGLSGKGMSAYGIQPGFPVVVRDTRTNKDTQLYFPNFNGLRAITFDTPASWEKTKPPRALAGGPSLPATATKGIERHPIVVESDKDFDIGMRICHTEIGHAVFPLPYTYLGKQGTERLHGAVTFTGFVEATNKTRLQIRISGIRFRITPGQEHHGIYDPSGMERLDSANYGGSELRSGAIIWDPAENWNTCE